MTNSPLLEHVLQEAEKLRAADERNALTANYFVVAFIDTLLAADARKLPKKLLEEGVELTEAEKLLAEKKKPDAALRAAIMEKIHAAAYRPTTDEFLYRKSLFYARELAKNASAETVTVAIYLKAFLDNMTAPLREALGIASAEPVAFTPPRTTAAPATEEQATTAAPANEGQATTASSEGTAAASTTGRRRTTKKTTATTTAEAADGSFPLTETVAKTVEIQKALLEKVVGQDLAVTAFASGYFQGLLTRATDKKHRGPMASFLFAGPPGVGKTFLAETAAEALALPFLRVDMSEYADDDSIVEFCGSDHVYKNGKEGNITRFLKENPKCIILFDEVEKAHISIIHLFLQILDSGNIRDNFTDELVSFGDAVIIFTTNVGRKLYEDTSITNLATVPRKKVLEAISSERDPQKGTLMFPTAICSRFASGNVLMFNRLGTDNLYFITKREIEKHTNGFREATGIDVTLDDKLPTALIFAAGGRADARTVRGRASTIFHEELYELFRLMVEDNGKVSKLRHVNVEVSLDKCAPETLAMFVNPNTPKVLVFAEGATVKALKARLPEVEVMGTDDLDTAKGLLFNHDFSIVLCDVRTGMVEDTTSFLNAEDIDSEGQDFLAYMLENHELPVYLLDDEQNRLSHAEYLSFARMGVREVIATDAATFAATVRSRCEVAYQQAAIVRLARESRVLSYKTAQAISANGETATISFSRFRFARATDADDSSSVLDAASKPNVRFNDVIGAEDAKRELTYFSEYLKDPRKFSRRGLRAPKGILLYGPPGTGKTLLAKALAGESDVTFLATEGNRFLRKFRGEGSEAVHDLFRTARKYAPAIIFIDEIDAVGKDRSEGRNDEAIGDVLTALLTEMDGFNQNPTKPVFVLAATNYAVDKESGKTLDPALLRRFDRRIYVDLPNKEERRRYCEMRLASSPAIQLSAAQLDNIAIRSVGMSLAELESVFEMALRNAVHSLDGTVGDAEFEEAFETFTSGERRKHSPEAVRRTACHEAGHALLCWLTGECPSYLTVVSRGDHGGYMQHGDHEDKGVYTRTELRNDIRTSLGGRAAELVYYGAEDGVTTGPSADLRYATRLAEDMICRYGMDTELGLSAVLREPGSLANYADIRRRTNEILGEELTAAIATVEKNRAAMNALIAALVEKNQLKGDEIDEILRRTAVR